MPGDPRKAVNARWAALNLAAGAARDLSGPNSVGGSRRQQMPRESNQESDDDEAESPSLAPREDEDEEDLQSGSGATRYSRGQHGPKVLSHPLRENVCVAWKEKPGVVG